MVSLGLVNLCSQGSELEVKLYDFPRFVFNFVTQLRSALKRTKRVFIYIQLLFEFKST